MGTIISTFGKAPEGIIQGIRKCGCDTLILLLEKNVRNKKGLKRIENLAKNLNIKLGKIVVDQYKVMDNIDKVKSLVKENDDVILNITGGRKTLSLATALAGFVSEPKKIIYITQEKNEIINIPKFTMYEKMLSKQKRIILNIIGKNNTLKDIQKKLKGRKDISSDQYAIRKHLRELTERSFIDVNKKNKPFSYSLTSSGRLIR